VSCVAHAAERQVEDGLIGPDENTDKNALGEFRRDVPLSAQALYCWIEGCYVLSRTR